MCAMPQRELSEAECLTRELIHRFYTGDGAWLHNHFAADFAGIGAQPEQYRICVEDIIINAAAVPDLVFINEVYEQIAQTDEMVIVMGQYEAYIAPGQEMVFADMQRFTVVWRKPTLDKQPTPAHDSRDHAPICGDGWRLIHWHLSNPLRASAPGERFPNQMAGDTSRTMSLMAEQKQYRREIQVQDVNSVVRRFLLFDVTYAESDGHNTVIHTADGGSCTVHLGLGAFCERFGLFDSAGFIQVRRGVVVNALYVRAVGEDVRLVDGTMLPVSQRKLSAVRTAFAVARRGDAHVRDSAGVDGCDD